MRLQFNPDLWPNRKAPSCTLLEQPMRAQTTFIDGRLPGLADPVKRPRARLESGVRKRGFACAVDFSRLGLFVPAS